MRLLHEGICCVVVGWVAREAVGVGEGNFTRGGGGGGGLGGGGGGGGGGGAGEVRWAWWKSSRNMDMKARNMAINVMVIMPRITCHP